MRVWLALGELARTRADLAEGMAMFRRREREAIASLDGVSADEHDLSILMATAEGLRLSLGTAADVCAIETARSTLANLLVRFDRSGSRARSV